MADKKDVYLSPEAKHLIDYGFEDDETILPPALTGKTYTQNPNTKVWEEVPKTTVAPSTAGYQGYKGATTYKVPTCTHSGDVAFQTPSGLWFCGATGRSALLHDLDVVFDLANVIYDSKRRVKYIKSGPPEVLKLNDKVTNVPDFVDIDWPDFSTLPYAGYEFWQGIAEWIEQRPNTNWIMATCQGGHGRTGTFLSILNGLYNKMDGKQSIKMIRDTYCEHAVETTEQERYICDILEQKF
jgi:hypothetical protein